MVDITTQVVMFRLKSFRYKIAKQSRSLFAKEINCSWRHITHTRVRLTTLLTMIQPYLQNLSSLLGVHRSHHHLECARHTRHQEECHCLCFFSAYYIWDQTTK